MRRYRAAVLALAVVAFPAASHAAARITIINADAAQEGLNDPTPRPPEGGNPGTTLGQQRWIAVQYAADIWAAMIDSRVEIRVEMTFDPLACSADSVVLGSAGPGSVYAGFPNAPIADTWYVSALASRLAAEDLDEGDPAISARFNSSLAGDPACGGGQSWYYGLDNDPGPNQVDLVVVVLHELAHGLGFSTVTDKARGALLGGRPDAYSNFLFDRDLALYWPQMTDQQRAGSARNTGNLVWGGANVTIAAPDVLDFGSFLEITSPDDLAGKYPIALASFGGGIDAAGVTGDVAAAVDAANSDGPAETDACTTLLNSSAIVGRIALIDRGDCTFASKAKRVQDSGAIAAIIANNLAGNPPSMIGTDPSITIPVIGVSQSDGAAIRSRLAAGVRASIRQDVLTLAGADELARPFLYAPEALASGSSVSHWDRSARPDLLMEPTISTSLGHEVDLTRDLLADLGWYSIGSVETALEASLLVDRDDDGEIDPGDVIRVTATLDNVSVVAANAVVFDAAIPDAVTVVAGSIVGGTLIDGTDRVRVALGTLPAASRTTVRFDILIDPALPGGVASLSLQATISGTNLPASVTDDPATDEVRDPTSVSVSHTPLRALKTVVLAVDSDQSGGLSSGDVIRYRVTITNHSTAPVAAVVFEDTVDESTALVPGSLRSDGTILGGNAPGDRAVLADLGVIEPGASVDIHYDVVVEQDLPAGTRKIVNQGTIRGDGIGALLTDDPATEQRGDPTTIRFPTQRRRPVSRF